jgi:hypothetical protein
MQVEATQYEILTSPANKNSMNWRLSSSDAAHAWRNRWTSQSILAFTRIFVSSDFETSTLQRSCDLVPWVDVRFTLNTATAMYIETSGQQHTAWLNSGNTSWVRGVTNTNGRDDGHIQGVLKGAEKMWKAVYLIWTQVVTWQERRTWIVTWYFVSSSSFCRAPGS